MAVYTNEPVIPSLIANTTMTRNFKDGVAMTYSIRPVDGYVLHDKAADWTELDEETGDEITKLGYTRGEASCAVSYNFVTNPREFYAVPEDSVPADQIFGAGNDHEVM